MCYSNRSVASSGLTGAMSTSESRRDDVSIPITRGGKRVSDAKLRKKIHNSNSGRHYVRFFRPLSPLKRIADRGSLSIVLISVKLSGFVGCLYC